MSLQSAITALTPALYWTLGEAAGSATVADSAGGGFPGTVSGDITLGVFGPELGTTAARIFTTGTILSPNWGSTVWSNFSVLAMVSVPANGAPSSPTFFAGLGDVANQATRGWRFQQQSSSNNALTASGNFNAGTATVATAQPLQTWHLWGFTYQSSPVSWRSFWDGTAGTAQTTSISAPPIATDKWWIQSTAQLVIAHFAVFTRTLSQTEIQTIATQVQAWPYQVPINTPIPIDSSQIVIPPTTVDLTPVLTQTTQILNNQGVYQPVITTDVPQILTTTNVIHGQTTTIETDTQNIVNTLLPQLADVVNDLGAGINDILNGITTTITTAAGSVTQKIGDFFSQHSKDVVGLSNATGGPTCDRVDLDVSNSHFWGVMVHITTRPPMYWAQTPDKDWSYPDLAVITIQRGGFDIYRKAVHGTWETIAPLPEALPEGVAGIAVPLLPQNYHIVVDWAFGVCGEVLLQYIP